ncbi:MAG: hypothetical protein LUG50_11600, partial [Planctomycetaceae bacterium]|nr:hypothetical protein [Planctomycetaceae bacterium]
FGVSPEAGAWNSFRGSRVAFSCVADGDLIFCLGIGKSGPNPDADLGWMLMTDDFDRRVYSNLLLAKRIFAVDVWEYARKVRIEQFVPPAYKAALRFWEWIGWKKGGVVSIGSRQAIHVYCDRPGVKED